jgi:hypothetical protein
MKNRLRLYLERRKFDRRVKELAEKFGKEEKIFVSYWGEGYALPFESKVQTLSEYSTDVGYDEEQVEQIRTMEVDQVVDCTDFLGQVHKVVRVR